MIPDRPCTPPPQRPPASLNFPSTPGPGCKRPVVGTEHSVVPPSPAPDAQVPEKTTPPDHALQIAPNSQVEQHAVASGAVLIGFLPKKKPTATQTVRRSSCKRALDRSFQFLDLPPEIRNMIYNYMHEKPSQALLVHRPRLASLRSRTRMDRSRIWPSDLAGMKHDEALAIDNHRSRSRKPGSDLLPRATNRPFFGLTQVCQQIRQEYRPIYMHKQEVGMDLTNIDAYLKTYYPGASALLSQLSMPRARNADLPFSGNITIAVGDIVKKAEASPEGIDVLPLLDVWANSFRIEAGFGRYIKELYVPMRDGEAKDLYRLFGRRVRRDRSCSTMNQVWRTTLRNRCLHAVRIHRAPLSKLVGGRYVPQNPYIHFIYREEWAEPWMISFHSEVPVDWLEMRGFTELEHYDIKVGIMPPKDAEAYVSYLDYKAAFDLMEPSVVV